MTEGMAWNESTETNPSSSGISKVHYGCADGGRHINLGGLTEEIKIWSSDSDLSGRTELGDFLN